MRGVVCVQFQQLSLMFITLPFSQTVLLAGGERTDAMQTAYRPVLMIYLCVFVSVVSCWNYRLMATVDHHNLCCHAVPAPVMSGLMSRWRRCHKLEIFRSTNCHISVQYDYGSSNQSNSMQSLSHTVCAQLINGAPIKCKIFDERTLQFGRQFNILF